MVFVYLQEMSPFLPSIRTLISVINKNNNNLLLALLFKKIEDSTSRECNRALSHLPDYVVVPGK
jgi:hypothetical protein